MVAEVIDNKLVIQAVIAQDAKLKSNEDVLEKLIIQHNSSVANQKALTEVGKKRLDKITEIEQPFRAALTQLRAATKDGTTIADFPGILGLGKIRWMPREQVYHLNIFCGYGTYEDGLRLNPRYERIIISSDGKILKIAAAPTRETS